MITFTGRVLAILFLLVCSVTHAASIWLVEGERNFILYGTIHLLKPEAFPLPSVYEQTFDQCDGLWLEVDTSELQDASIMRELQGIMLLPAGQQLENELSKNTYAQLEILAQKAGVSMSLLQGLKPWAAANQLTLMIFQQNGFTGAGLDPYLHEQAAKRNIPIYPFETLVWQMNMFDELSSRNTNAFIDFSTEGIDDINGLIDGLYRHWQTGSIDALYEQAEFDDYPDIEFAMLEQRNNAWFETLMTSDKSGTQCVAVGALHMAASHGLIRRFETEGFKVTQLNAKP